MTRQFHRPASLDPEQAEEIVGDEDPAAESGLAHSTAWALLGVPSEDFSAQDLPRVLSAVREQGVDVLAESWSRSPEFTLPGALWRLYLLLQWNELNPAALTERYAEGLAAMARQDHDVEAPDLDEVMRAVEATLTGYATDDDLAPVLAAASHVMRVLAASVQYGPEWITTDDHVLAHRVTRRPTALLATADELDESARQARAGTLN